MSKSPGRSGPRAHPRHTPAPLPKEGREEHHVDLRGWRDPNVIFITSFRPAIDDQCNWFGHRLERGHEMGVNGATDVVTNANLPPRNPDTDFSKQMKDFQEALSSANETNSPLGVAKQQLDYLISKGEQLDPSKLDPSKCFGPEPTPTGPELRAASGNKKPYFEPKTPISQLGNLFTPHLEDPGVAGNLTVCPGVCFGAGGS
jgi:hypothetical protein